MSLFSEWKEITDAERNEQETKEFWNKYFDMETDNYKKLLGDHEHVREGKLCELAEEFGMDEVTFTGFLDGINSSLKKELKLDSLKSGSKIELNIDFEKLYFNMLDAKANWLYGLPEWDAILSEDKRKMITKEFRASKMFIKQQITGRNDPCPCGSGKKYKKCCGAGK
ncbi:MAG: SEC-C metal-binding domain-containing protein [Clostridia bacterium]